jgi:hypothetical protein
MKESSHDEKNSKVSDTDNYVCGFCDGGRRSIERAVGTSRRHTVLDGWRRGMGRGLLPGVAPGWTGRRRRFEGAGDQSD